jgi:hypothetical protein
MRLGPTETRFLWREEEKGGGNCKTKDKTPLLKGREI